MYKLERDSFLQKETGDNPERKEWLRPRECYKEYCYCRYCSMSTSHSFLFSFEVLRQCHINIELQRLQLRGKQRVSPPLHLSTPQRQRKAGSNTTTRSWQRHQRATPPNWQTIRLALLLLQESKYLTMQSWLKIVFINTFKLGPPHNIRHLPSPLLPRTTAFLPRMKGNTRNNTNTQTPTKRKDKRRKEKDITETENTKREKQQ